MVVRLPSQADQPAARAFAPVHVWTAGLDLPDETLRRLEGTLSPDERSRAARYRFARDRQRFVAARGHLRAILAGYTGTEPAQIRFRYGASGKPALDPDHASGLTFNLSHSGGLAAYAIAWHRALGIDLEEVRPGINAEQVAARFFSPSEQAALRRCPSEERLLAFLACWTRKEAYLKARGTGLTSGLSGFSVPVAPHLGLSPVRLAVETGERTCWTLRDLRLGDGFVAALVVGGEAWCLTHLQPGSSAPAPP